MSKAIIAALVVAVLGGLGLGTYDPPSNLVQGGAPDVEPVAQMPDEIVAEQPPAEPSEPVWEEEPVYYDYEPDYWEPEPYVEPEPAYASEGETPDLYTMGVVSDGERTYTWYSENVLPGNGLTDLNNNGRHLDDRGFVVDGDGYIAAASPWGSEPIGTVIDTPYGPAKIYDANEGDATDLYTGW